MDGKLIGSAVELKNLAIARPCVTGYWSKAADQILKLEQGMAWKISESELPQGGTFRNAKYAIRMYCRKLGVKLCIRTNTKSILIWKHDDEYSILTSGKIIRRIQ